MHDVINNLISGGNDNSLGGAIQNLIQDNIRNINTCFLAKVVAIENNKVDVIDIIKNNDNNNNVIIPNVLVAQPYTSLYKISYPINVGDIGLCIVCKKDISIYKKNGKEAIANTRRVFNIVDSVYMPLSLYNQDTLDNKNMFIGSKDSNIKIGTNTSLVTKQFKVKAKDNITLEGKLLAIRSENTTLKTMLSELIDLVSNLIVDTPQGVGSINPASKQLLSQWKANLNNLLKE